jgi:AdoMet-dependent heme synthase
MMTGGPPSSSAKLRLVAWETTRRCHLQCQHCRGAARDEKYEGELTEEEAKLVIDAIASFARPILILTGGEPMLRTDIYDIARYATDRSIRVVMSPCGRLINKESSALIKKSGIQRISISLDGSNAKTHDAFRGVPGAFNAALNGIKHLREAGIEFQINTTVTKLNRDELEAILDLATNLGAIAFNPFFLVPTGRGAAIAAFELSPVEYEKALAWVYEKSRSESIEVRPTCAPHFNRIASKRRDGLSNEKKQEQAHGHQAVSRGCLGGAEFIFISHRGKVQPCGFLDIECGDLRASDFNLQKIYETSPVFLAIRNRPEYHGKCGVCEYLHSCGGCRARAFAQTGDYRGEEPFCIYMPPVNAGTDREPKNSDSKKHGGPHGLN